MSCVAIEASHAKNIDHVALTFQQPELSDQSGHVETLKPSTRCERFESSECVHVMKLFHYSISKAVA
jgi:hypothetical protein